MALGSSSLHTFLRSIPRQTKYRWGFSLSRIFFSDLCEICLNVALGLGFGLRLVLESVKQQNARGSPWVASEWLNVINRTYSHTPVQSSKSKHNGPLTSFICMKNHQIKKAFYYLKYRCRRRKQNSGTFQEVSLGTFDVLQIKTCFRQGT